MKNRFLPSLEIAVEEIIFDAVINIQVDEIGNDGDFFGNIIL